MGITRMNSAVSVRKRKDLEPREDGRNDEHHRKWLKDRPNRTKLRLFVPDVDAVPAEHGEQIGILGNSLKLRPRGAKTPARRRQHSIRKTHRRGPCKSRT